MRFTVSLPHKVISPVSLLNHTAKKMSREAFPKITPFS